jgi:hypothetical protein
LLTGQVGQIILSVAKISDRDFEKWRLMPGDETKSQQTEKMGKFDDFEGEYVRKCVRITKTVSLR